MKDVFGYIRVSTARQGEKGVSLVEQKDAIERYAQRNQLNIVQWFEERETAAKQGRVVFTNMLNFLKSGMADGVVIHKIDRSARNLRDWADVVDLSDQGIEIHFVNESIDLNMRGGRLSADIQAVVAADYIRNLREETIKGLKGRLKQGLYPWAAPIGYLDRGGGRAKEIDPIKAPLVRELFARYASGDYSIRSLLAYSHTRGIRNRNENLLTKNGLLWLLRNSFYCGLIHVKKTGDTFRGIHEPLINKDLFDRVQRILDGKAQKTLGKKRYQFGRLITCSGCSRKLIGELQKGRVYYRCHLCPGMSIREDKIEEDVAKMLGPFKLTTQEVEEVERLKTYYLEDSDALAEREQTALNLEIEKLKTRLSSLTDAMLEGIIDKESYIAKKTEYQDKIITMSSRLKEVEQGIQKIHRKVQKFLELYKTAYLGYISKDIEQRRKILEELTSNCVAHQKSVEFTLYSPFKEICEAKNNGNVPIIETNLELLLHSTEWGESEGVDIEPYPMAA